MYVHTNTCITILAYMLQWEQKTCIIMSYTLLLCSNIFNILSNIFKPSDQNIFGSCLRFAGKGFVLCEECPHEDPVEKSTYFISIQSLNRSCDLVFPWPGSHETCDPERMQNRHKILDHQNLLSRLVGESSMSLKLIVFIILLKMEG